MRLGNHIIESPFCCTLDHCYVENKVRLNVQISKLNSLYLVLSDNTVSVGGTISVNVINSLVHVGHDLHGAGQLSVLLGELLCSRRTECQDLRQLGTRKDLNIVLLQRIADLHKR